MAKEVVENFQELVDSIHKPTHKPVKKPEGIFVEDYWSLYKDGTALEPLKFSNGKTQKDVVREVVEHARAGKKVIFVHGVCGTGKSAIALNVARALGRASIVVPVKTLQKQYEQDYAQSKYVLKPNGQKLSIAMITGRDNHDSVLNPGSSCADPSLPENVRITEKNRSMLMNFYDQNPFIKSKSFPLLKELKRISIAPANPYWSPILPARYDAPLKDANKKKYLGLNGQEFVFYHRKRGCTYYDQYQSYIDADVIIFNAAKYKIETALNRRPETDVDIIDEADEFLDSFSQQQSLNITRLGNVLGSALLDSYAAKESARAITELADLEQRQRQALGINEFEIIRLTDSRIHKVLALLLKAPELEDEAIIDEGSYLAHAYEVARSFEDFFDETYLTFRREENDLVASLVTTNISHQFQDLVSKTKTLVLMSGTLHTPRVIQSIFGIKDYALVEAETRAPGEVEIVRSGKEMDCRYSHFEAKKHTREDYLRALSACVTRAKRPTLVHVNAFEDLPTFEERAMYNLTNLPVKDQLKAEQQEDKNDKRVTVFKSGQTDILFTTKCARGVDFPGSTCNSVVFTKYPNPNPRETFWKVLERTHKDWFWDLYKDKASRELLQRLYRALRSPTDHVFVLSPDLRVLEAIRQLQAST